MNTTQSGATSKNSAAREASSQELHMPRSIFFISPIGSPGSEKRKKADYALKYIVEVAFPLPNWTVLRGDADTNADSITNQIIERILSSDLIIADLTDSNPNVFYELAVAHGYRRPVVHMMEHGQSVPFDLADQRVVHYDLTDAASVSEAHHALPELAQSAIAAPEKQRNPLTTHSAFTEFAASKGDPGDLLVQTLSDLIDRIQTLDRRMQQLERTGHGGTPRRSVTHRDKEAHNQRVGGMLMDEFRMFDIECDSLIWNDQMLRIRFTGEIPEGLREFVQHSAKLAAQTNGVTVQITTPTEYITFDRTGTPIDPEVP